MKYVDTYVKQFINFTLPRQKIKIHEKMSEPAACIPMYLPTLNLLTPIDHR